MIAGLECKSFPREPMVAQNYAVALHAAGRRDEARTEFDRALAFFEGGGDLSPGAYGCRKSGVELLLQNYAKLERNVGNLAAATHYEELAAGCKNVGIQLPMRYSARGCACWVGMVPSDASLPAWLLAALGCAARWRRRRHGGPVYTD